MKWYAVQIKAGGTKPSAKDDRLFAVEWEMQRAGYGDQFYFPVEPKDIIHHRTKKPIHRRFPLIPGYGFICDVTDFWTLDNCRHVSQVLGVGGEPLTIDEKDIQEIMAEETRLYEELSAGRARERRRQRIASGSQRVLAKHYPSGAAITVATGYLSGRKGRIESVTGRQTVKAILDMLGKMTPVELPVDDVVLDDYDLRQMTA